MRSSCRISSMLHQPKIGRCLLHHGGKYCCICRLAPWHVSLQLHQARVHTCYCMDSLLSSGFHLSGDTENMLQRLVSFVIGSYDLRTHAGLEGDLRTAKCQDGATHLQLAFSVSMPVARRQPGCLLVMGDVNAKHIWMPIRPTTLADAVGQMDAPDMPDDGSMLARAADLIRNRLGALTSSPNMPTINEASTFSNSNAWIPS